MHNSAEIVRYVKFTSCVWKNIAIDLIGEGILSEAILSDMGNDRSSVLLRDGEVPINFSNGSAAWVSNNYCLWFLVC